jgi:hypothetical protein
MTRSATQNGKTDASVHRWTILESLILVHLTLLETQRSLYQAQDNQISINQGQLAAFVQLRKALA